MCFVTGMVFSLCQSSTTFNERVYAFLQSFPLRSHLQCRVLPSEIERRAAVESFEFAAEMVGVGETGLLGDAVEDIFARQQALACFGQTHAFDVVHRRAS